MPFGRDDHIAEADLSAFLDAQLSGVRRARCEAHLRDCPPCSDALDGLRAVRASLQALPRATAPRSFRVQETQDELLRSRQPAFILRIMPQLAGLSVVSLVAFFSLVAVNTTGGLGSSSDSDGSSLMAAPSARESISAEDSAGAAPEDGAGAPSPMPPEATTQGQETMSPSEDRATSAPDKFAATQSPMPPEATAQGGESTPLAEDGAYSVPDEVAATPGVLSPGATTEGQESMSPADGVATSAPEEGAATPSTELPPATSEGHESVPPLADGASPTPQVGANLALESPNQEGAAVATSVRARAGDDTLGSSDDDSDTAIYIAMAVTAAIAAGSGGLAFAAYRRTR